MSDLILASSSPARQELLNKFRMPFTAISPDVDETRRKGEYALTLANRLAADKACVVANQHPDRWVIGSDQVAVYNDDIFGKPKDLETARQQLRCFSGQTVTFITGVCLLNQSKEIQDLRHDHFQVRFRQLNDGNIEQYLHTEKPFNCCAGLSLEGLGFTLVKALEGRDFSSLIGLPLILLTDMLRDNGVKL